MPKNSYQKRDEVAARQAVRDGRSASEQLEIIKTRRGKSRKETARLKHLGEKKGGKP